MSNRKRQSSEKRNRRRGLPFTFYLRRAQAERLNLVSRNRHVPKSELVRMAIDRFLLYLVDEDNMNEVGLNS